MSLMRDVSQAHPRYSDLPGWADLIETTEQYAVPRWYFATYFLLILYTVCAADNGVKCSTWKRLRIQLTARHAVQMHNKPQPPFRSRFIIGLCGVLTVLIAIGMSVAVAHSLFGAGMARLFDELPFLMIFSSVGSVFSLLDASTATYEMSEQLLRNSDEWKPKAEVYFVDRVNQIAVATSLSGPGELLTSFAKATLVLTDALLSLIAQQRFRG
jgi:hypothetical protein